MPDPEAGPLRRASWPHRFACQAQFRVGDSKPAFGLVDPRVVVPRRNATGVQCCVCHQSAVHSTCGIVPIANFLCVSAYVFRGPRKSLHCDTDCAAAPCIAQYLTRCDGNHCIFVTLSHVCRPGPSRPLHVYLTWRISVALLCIISRTAYVL